ncbi:hypothetical protein V6Z93_005536 [Aspergillus fumigatus]
MLVERIEVGPDRAGKQCRILRDNTHSRTQMMELDLADVDVIDENAPFLSFEKPK